LLARGRLGWGRINFRKHPFKSLLHALDDIGWCENGIGDERGDRVVCDDIGYGVLGHGGAEAG
jgi:hypothetical protein